MSYAGQAVFGGTTDPVTGSWNNATALNAAVTTTDITGYGVVACSFVITGTITQGTAIFEVSDDAGTTWWPISGLQTGNNLQVNSFALTGSSASFEFATGAYNLFRARLNPVILGSGSVAVRLSAEAFPFMTTVAVTGTVGVSLTGTRSVELQDGSGNAITSTLNSGKQAIDVNVTGQPISVTGTVAVTQSTSPWVVSLTSTTITGTVAVTQSTSPWTIQGDSASGATNAGNPVKIGGAFNTTQPTVTTGQTVDAQMTARGAQIVAVGVDGFAVTVGGTVAVTQSTSPWVVSLASTTITGTVAVTQSTSPWVTNMTQWASTALGVPTAFGTTPGAVVAGSVNASLFIGTVAAVASSAGVQKVGISGGTGTTLETTAGVLDYNLKNVNNAVVNVGIGASSTGTQRVSVSNDSQVKVWDGSNQATVKAASTAPVVTDTAIVVTISPNTPSVPVTQSPASTSNTSAATWTSATALNTAIVLNASSFTYASLLLTLNTTTTITAGAVTFEVSNDNSNWVAISGVNAGQFGSLGVNGVYPLSPSTYITGIFNTTAWQNFRVRLSTQITGTGSLVIGFAAQAAGAPPIVSREPKDFGRTFICITQDDVVGPAAEALTAFTINRGGVQTTGQTTYTVTAGKTLRLQSVNVSLRSTSGTQDVKTRIRSAASVLATSPILWQTLNSATTTTFDRDSENWPDGLEVAGGQQIGISSLNVGGNTTGLITLSFVGYEY